MFNASVATRRYYKIINFYKDVKVDVGENHHIVPKSLGGNNKSDNMVRLPARVHFIVHWLLTRMVSGIHKSKMVYAFWAMMNPQKIRGFEPDVSSRQYEKTKDAIRTHMSNNNPMHREDVLAIRRGVKRPEQASVMGEVNKIRWGEHVSTEELVCKHCHNEFIAKIAEQRQFCSRSCRTAHCNTKRRKPK